MRENKISKKLKKIVTPIKEKKRNVWEYDATNTTSSPAFASGI